jgi:hypothetical protein
VERPWDESDENQGYEGWKEMRKDVDGFVVEVGEALETELDRMGNRMITLMDQGFAVPCGDFLVGEEFGVACRRGWDRVVGLSFPSLALRAVLSAAVRVGEWRSDVGWCCPPPWRHIGDGCLVSQCDSY